MYQNALRINPKTGTRYMGKMLTEEAKDWKLRAALLVKSSMGRSSLEPIKPSTPFSVDIWFYWRERRSQLDADGAMKMLLDSMNKIVFSSDKYSMPRVLGIDYDEKNPRVELVVSCPPTQLVEIE